MRRKEVFQKKPVKKIIQFIASCSLGALSVAPSVADDIDIFYSTSNFGNADTLVMFVLDWRPNFYSTMCNGECLEFHEALDPYLKCEDDTCATIRRYDLFRAALKKVLAEINLSGNIGLNVGLMLNHGHFAESGVVCDGYQSGGSAKKCSNGGYILQDFVPIFPEDGDGWNSFFSKLDALPNPSGG